MSEIRFTAELGADRVIRLPEHLCVPPGLVDVTIVSQHVPAGTAANSENIAQRLARAARELNITDLPADLAENHDYYAHGAPKGVDRP